MDPAHGAAVTSFVAGAVAGLLIPRASICPSCPALACATVHCGPAPPPPPHIGAGAAAVCCAFVAAALAALGVAWKYGFLEQRLVRGTVVKAASPPTPALEEIPSVDADASDAAGLGVVALAGPRRPSTRR